MSYYDELDDNDFEDYDPDEPEDSVVCPECGSDALDIVSEDFEGNNLYECQDCGERFTEEEDDE